VCKNKRISQAKVGSRCHARCGVAGADVTINKRNATWTTNAASKTSGDADPSPLTTGASAAAPNNFLGS